MGTSAHHDAHYFEQIRFSAKRECKLIGKTALEIRPQSGREGSETITHA